MILRYRSDGLFIGGASSGMWHLLSDAGSLPPWASIEGDRGALKVRRIPDTCADLYHMVWMGAWYVSDELRRLVELLPVSERDVSSDTRAYLRAFRSLPYARAIVGPIRRAHMFESLTCIIDSAGPVLSSCVEPLSVEQTVDSIDAACEVVTASLARAIRRVPSVSGSRLLLSGGVDSTLLATFLRDSGVRYAVTVPSFAEYAEETLYAEEAARILGVRLERVPANAQTLQQLLVDAVCDSLQPPNHTQTVLLYAAFRSEPGIYLTAQFADALFGFGRSTTGFAARRLAYALHPLSLFPARKVFPKKVQSALRVHEALSRPPEDFESWTATYARYLSAAGAERMVGRDTIQRLSHERAQLTLSTYPGPLPAAVDQPMALGQWLDFIHDDAIAIWSAMARSVNSRLVAPHHSNEMVEASFRVRLPLRYSDRVRAKPVLRELLQRRLPQYDTNKQKLASGLPMERMVREGYPDLFEDARTDELRELTELVPQHDPDWAEMVWGAIAARLWERAVSTLPFSPERYGGSENVGH